GRSCRHATSPSLDSPWVLNSNRLRKKGVEASLDAADKSVCATRADAGFGFFRSLLNRFGSLRRQLAVTSIVGEQSATDRLRRCLPPASHKVAGATYAGGQPQCCRHEIVSLEKRGATGS